MNSKDKWAITMAFIGVWLWLLGNSIGQSAIAHKIHALEKRVQQLEQHQ